MILSQFHPLSMLTTIHLPRFPSDHFHRVFSEKILYAFYAQLIVTSKISQPLMVLSDLYISQNSSLSNILNCPFNSSLIGWNILLSTSFPNAHSYGALFHTSVWPDAGRIDLHLLSLTETFVTLQEMRRTQPRIRRERWQVMCGLVLIYTLVHHAASNSSSNQSVSNSSAACSDKKFKHSQ
jgi:hypothetical protein